jgi:hypothetical protein
MKIRLTFKDPDGIGESIEKVAEESLKMVDGISNSEREALTESRIEEIGSVLSKWILYGDYCSVEFDTDAGTARVLESKERV